MKFWAASLIFISQFAFAQLDPSSGLLLNSDPKSSYRANGLDSGRYTVRPHNDSTSSSPKKAPQAKANDRNNDRDEDDDTAVVEAKPLVQVAPTPAPTPAPIVETKTQPIMQAPKTPDTEANFETPKPASAVDEKKKNIIEISIAPLFIYNHSSSDLSFRNYSTSDPGYSLEVAAWLQPNFALHAQIINSLASSVNDSYDRSKNTNLVQQWISGGLRYRNFLSSQRNSASLTLGLDYEDYQFQVGTDAQMRNRLETSGIDLSLNAEIPRSSHYSWEFGVDFMPKAKHLETLTSASLQSGDSPEADVLGVSIGGRIYVDSSNQMFWKITERLEKDQFMGTTSKPDPSGNQTLTNVSVTNSFTLIQIGYTWGN